MLALIHKGIICLMWWCVYEFLSAGNVLYLDDVGSFHTRTSFCFVAWRSSFWWKRLAKEVSHLVDGIEYCPWKLGFNKVFFFQCTHTCLVTCFRSTTVEETTFHLLQLTLFREYLDYEFSSLKVEEFLSYTQTQCNLISKLC